MKRMKNGDIMRRMYVGLDIHEEYLTGAAMNNDTVKVASELSTEF